MPVGVITDTTCDLPVATLKRARVHAVPLWVHVGSDRYRDWHDLEPGTAVELISNQGIVPLVKSPSVEDLMRSLDRALQEHEHVLAIHVASAFSSTFSHCAAAIERLGAGSHVTLIDSGSVGPGLAELVLAAANLARKGVPPAEISGHITALRGDIHGFLSPTAAGWGRNGKLFGRMRERRYRALGRRPIVGMHASELTTLRWTTERRLAELLVAAVAARYGTRPIHLAISHTGPGETGLVQLQEAVERSGLQVERGRLQRMGAALTARLGLGSAALFARPLD